MAHWVALSAMAAISVVLANLRPTALSTNGTWPVVMANRGTTALTTLVAHSAVFTDRGTAALSTCMALPTMLAEISHPFHLARHAGFTTATQSVGLKVISPVVHTTPAASHYLLLGGVHQLNSVYLLVILCGALL